jgi:hypothetical protein
MKAIVLAEGNIAIVTLQPSNVDLYSSKADQSIYNGFIEGIQNQFIDNSTETNEI